MPDWRAEIRKRLSTLSVDPSLEASVVEEISQHLDDRYAELLDGGATPEAARAAALDELVEPALADALTGRAPAPRAEPHASPRRG